MARIFLTFLVLILPPAVHAQTAPDGKVDYVVKRNGEKIGALKMEFRQEGNRLVVTSDYGIQIRLMSIVLYRYDKRMTETYEDGRLVGYAAKIDDNGGKSSVSAVPDGDGLTIMHRAGTVNAPPGLYPSTYWPPETVNQTRLIDSSDGVLVDVKTEPVAEENLKVDGRTLKAKRYRMTGDLERDLWYAADGGEWLKMRMKASDGSVIEIERDWPPVWKRGLL
mgnify:CR=1 FL=1